MIRKPLLKAWKQVFGCLRQGGQKCSYLIIGLVFILLNTWLFGALAEDIIRRDSLTLYDPYIGEWLLNHTSTAGDHIFYTITLLGSFSVVETVVIAFGLWLVLKKRWPQLVTLLTAVSGGTLLNLILKSMFSRPRPNFTNALYHETSYSFPSGHTMTAVFAYGIIAYLIASFVKNSKWRVVLYAAAVLLALVIGLSRIYLGVHYLTDVLGGWAAGSAWLFSCILVTKTLKMLE
ncbi:MAG: phosphatase PAP2 family protein [Chloroflexota bacterium]|jgi:undecaprenyl-diphosphatase